MTKQLTLDGGEDEPQSVALTGPRTGSQIVETLASDLAGVRAESLKGRERERFRRALAGLVFSYWAAKFLHPKALLGPDRERVIVARLKECNDNVSDLLWALDGALKDDWTMGRAKHSTQKYDGLETILRSRAQVEKHAERMRGFNEDRVHAMATKYVPEVPK